MKPLACVFVVPGVMSQGRISYSRIIVVGIIFLAFLGVGFVAGRGGTDAGQDSDRMIAELEARLRIKDQKTSREIATLKASQLIAVEKASREIASLKAARLDAVENALQQVAAHKALQKIKDEKATKKIAALKASQKIRDDKASELIASLRTSQRRQYNKASREIAVLKAARQRAEVEIHSLKEQVIAHVDNGDARRSDLAKKDAMGGVTAAHEGYVAFNDLAIDGMAIRLAFENVVPVSPKPTHKAPVSTMGKTDFSTPNPVVFADADLENSYLNAPFFFYGLSGKFSNQFAVPSWINRPANSGLLVSRAVLPSDDGEVAFFGGLTETEFRTREIRCLAKAIYHESRGEVQKGQFAVAQTIMNRVRDDFFPDTICGVIYENSHKKNRCQFSFACDGISDKPKDKKLWDIALDNARLVTAGKIWLDDIGYASHYHATYVRPKWRRYMHKIKRIGVHIFYRAKFLPLPEEIALRAPKKSSDTTE